MINPIFYTQFLRFFNNQPNSDQILALQDINDFVFGQNPYSVFILKGYAGTGKTSLVAAVVNALNDVNVKCMLLAPTGRAAKVLAGFAKHPAFTIHKVIYRQKNYKANPDFDLGFNTRRNVLFVVDEASMISSNPDAQNMRESLLEGLLSFVYGRGNGCRLMLIGDDAQLPPVGEDDSPALKPEVISRFGLTVFEAQLNEVVRQDRLSGILWNATNIRQLVAMREKAGIPVVRFDGFTDIVNIPGNDLLETITTCYQNDGIDETIVICRSNRLANIYNNGIRNQILWRENELEAGDFVMVAKNNYYWTDKMNCQQRSQQETAQTRHDQLDEMDFVANGDIAVVKRVRNIRELYGFKFADCILEFPDYHDFELEATVILDALQSESPAISPQQSEQLYNQVMEDYMDIPQQSERLKKLRQDPYYNALQLKYAYAVTCHKAQGGQWMNVFVEQGFVPEDTSPLEYSRWLYTAITRATGKLYLVNWKNH
jgi:exodeoxyribonuclease-5